MKQTTFLLAVLMLASLAAGAWAASSVSSVYNIPNCSKVKPGHECQELSKDSNQSNILMTYYPQGKPEEGDQMPPQGGKEPSIEWLGPVRYVEILSNKMDSRGWNADYYLDEPMTKTMDFEIGLGSDGLVHWRRKKEK